MARSVLSQAWGLLLGSYLFSVSLAIPYYNWQYAREHGFVKWLLLGEFVATGQAIVWPLSLASVSSRPEWTSEEKANGVHAIKAMEASHKAIQLSNAGGHAGVISQSAMERIQDHRRVAVAEAKRVQDSVLEKAHPGLSKVFRDSFQRGLELRISAVESRSMAQEIEGSRLLDQWFDWLDAHGDDVRIPK